MTRARTLLARAPVRIPARAGARARGILFAVGLVASVLVAPAAPALAAACSGTSGVTVVVSSPAGTSVRCAPGDPSSGLAALSGAGYSVTQVQTQPGFVCRIDGYPASDPCVRTPPASASWSYWHARRGGSWSYATAGAASYNPAPGTVEGWSFGSGSPPAVAPPPPTATSSPSPSPSPSSSSPASSSSSSSPKPVTSKAVSTPRAVSPWSNPAASTPRSSVGSSTPLTRPSSDSKPITSTTTARPTFASTTNVPATSELVTSAPNGQTTLAAGPTSADPGAGSPWPLLGGTALVLALGAAAAYAARRARAH